MTGKCTLDLSGEWHVRLDPDRKGRQDNWADQPLREHTASLPGALREHGIGNPVGPDTDWIGRTRDDDDDERYAPYRTADNFKVPHWLQPEYHYVGPAWYQKSIDIPQDWRGKRIVLHLERPHWQTTVFLDGNRVGSNNSLSTPHEYDLTDALTPGEHRLTLRIDNSTEPIDVGENAHSVSDHTQTAWNGVVGDVSLRATPRVHIDDLQVYPNAAAGTARVELRIGNTGSETTPDIELTVGHDGTELAGQSIEKPVPPGGTTIETTLHLDDPPTWDEFDPALCRLEATVATDSTTDHERVRFGLRDVSTEGTRITVNDRPIVLRGTLECCVFPETGYPPTDVEAWRDRIQTCKDHGLNHIRFHSWCPPAAAFEAADELGCYLQIECSSWANESTGLGTGEPVDEWLYTEGERILAAYGNHPSFLLFAYGNEPGGNDEAYLSEWVSTFSERAERCLVTGGSGWPLIEENEFHVTPDPRIHPLRDDQPDLLNDNSPDTTADYRDYIEEFPETPVLSHENGQWCAYPNFEEIQKYTGQLRATNFEVFRDFLADAGLLDNAGAFVRASGALQERCYKAEIESALRTPGMAGFQLLMLHDFPGQGTAPVGMLDAFFDAKPYHDVDRFREYAGATVPLARLDRRTFEVGDRLTADIDIAHFGPEDLTDGALQWELTDTAGGTVAEGEIDVPILPTGHLHDVGEIEIDLDGADPPEKLTLSVEIPQTDVRNTWDIWVFPDAVETEPPSEVRVATGFDAAVRERLQDGDTVVLFPDPESITTDIKLGFSTVFWNTDWVDVKASHTLGLLPKADHRALEAFPTQAHTDWQWWDPIHHAAPMELDRLPDALEPIIGIVPDWADPKTLGLAFEVRVGDGRLLATSIDLAGDLSDRPAARQLRHSLLQYVATDAFDPDIEVEAGAVAEVFD